MAGIKSAAIVLTLCVLSHVAYGEDLDSLKTELLNLKMQVRPLSGQQMAAAGGGGLVCGNTFAVNCRGGEPARLFPVVAEGIDLKSAFMFAPAAASKITSRGRMADADKAFYCMQAVYGRIRWVVLHVGRMLCATAGSGRRNACRGARTGSRSAPYSCDRFSDDAVFRTKQKTGCRTAMLTAAWRF